MLPGNMSFFLKFSHSSLYGHSFSGLLEGEDLIIGRILGTLVLAVGMGRDNLVSDRSFSQHSKSAFSQSAEDVLGSSGAGFSFSILIYNKGN